MESERGKLDRGKGKGEKGKGIKREERREERAPPPPKASPLSFESLWKNKQKKSRGDRGVVEPLGCPG